MQGFSRFVERIVSALNSGRVKYMLTGAMASSYYGRPRTTIDLDVIISCSREELPGLARKLRTAGLQVNLRMLRECWQSDYRILTATDKWTPHTLDMIFSDEKLLRRRGRILGRRTYYQSPESLILAKLRMLKVTMQPERAENDREDIRAILKSTKMNLKSLRKHARSQGTFDILANLLIRS